MTELEKAKAAKVNEMLKEFAARVSKNDNFTAEEMRYMLTGVAMQDILLDTIHSTVRGLISFFEVAKNNEVANHIRQAFEQAREEFRETTNKLKSQNSN